MSIGEVRRTGRNKQQRYTNRLAVRIGSKTRLRRKDRIRARMVRSASEGDMITGSRGSGGVGGQGMRSGEAKILLDS